MVNLVHTIPLPENRISFVWLTPATSPGRFYMSVAAKMILSEFILNYDLKLENPSAPRSLAWSFAQVPHPLTKILIRKRAAPEVPSCRKDGQLRFGKTESS